MVLNQLKTHGINHPKLIDAFLSIARERFVPPAFYNLCYYDHEIQLSPGRFLFSPVTLARLLQRANPIPGKKALVVGGGAGYSAAVLSLCGVDCYMVESQDLLFEQATSLLPSFHNVHCLHDELIKGWVEHAPFDIILIDGGAVPFVPNSILQQLNPEGGQLFALVQDELAAESPDISLCQAVCIEALTGEFKTHILFEGGSSTNLEFIVQKHFSFF